MSKIVILLCVVLVASAVGADTTDGELKSLHTRVKFFLSTEIGNIELKYNNSRSIIRKNAEKIKAAAHTSIRKYIADVDAIMRKVSEETYQLVIQSLRMDNMEDCFRLTNAITNRARDWLSVVLECQDDIPRVAFRHMGNMDSEFQLVHKTLIEYMDRNDDCCRIFNATNLIDFAFLCTEGIEIDAKEFIAKHVPPMLEKIPETVNFMTNLMSSFANCSNNYDTFQTEVADLSSKAKACYYKKINDAAGLSVIPLDIIKAELTDPSATDKDCTN